MQIGVEYIHNQTPNYIINYVSSVNLFGLLKSHSTYLEISGKTTCFIVKLNIKVFKYIFLEDSECSPKNMWRIRCFQLK